MMRRSRPGAGGDVGQLGAQFAGGQRPVAEEGLQDPLPDRVQEEISGCHAAHRSGLFSPLLTFSMVRLASSWRTSLTSLNPTAALLLLLVLLALAIPLFIRVARFEASCLADLAEAEGAELLVFSRQGWAAIILLMIPIGGFLYLRFGRIR